MSAAAASTQAVSSGMALSRFLPVAWLWLVLAWLAATRAPTGLFWQALLALLWFAVPLALVGLYDLSIAKTLRRERLRRDGRLFRWFSGRTLPALLLLAWALLVAPLLLLRLYLLTTLEWALLAAVVPLHWLLFTVLRYMLRHEFKPWLLDATAQTWARLLSPTLLLLPYFLLLWWQHTPSPNLTLTDAIAGAQQQVSSVAAGASMALLVGHLAILDGIETFVLAHLQTDVSGVFVLVAALDMWMRSYLLCVILGVFLWRRNDWRRLFGPLSDQLFLPALRRSRIAWSAAVIAFMLCFVYVPFLAWLELQVRMSPALAQTPARLRLRVEQIGDAFYAPGTLAALQQSRQRAVAQLDIASMQLRADSNVAFDAMADQVDPFLDWYYSLGGEYGRIAHLLGGDLEQYMARQLGERLRQDAAFARVESTLTAALAESEQARALHARLMNTILAQNRLEPGQREIDVVLAVPAPSVPRPDTLLDLQQRLVLSGSGAATAGVLGSVIAGKFGTKMLGKSSFKLAAQGLGKLLAGKAAGSSLGAGGGAAAGAALGSFIPGFGTVAGAMLGGVLGGVVTGIGVDKVLIELEELVSREQFRAELLLVIEEMRQEFLAEL